LAWVKPFVSWRPGQRVVYSWEPIIVKLNPERQREIHHRERDWILEGRVTGSSIPGAKPAAVARWLFAIMGLRHDDVFVDLFPGSGMVTKAWNSYSRRGAGRANSRRRVAVTDTPPSTPPT